MWERSAGVPEIVVPFGEDVYLPEENIFYTLYYKRFWFEFSYYSQDKNGSNRTAFAL